MLDRDRPKRQRALDEDLQQFDYINGQLFSEHLPIANFDKAMRERLLEACGFGWDTISPAIFGSLFQAVMKPAERRKKGAHYTTERNILKVIQPLFLDDLRAEFERLRARRDTRRRAELEALHERLAALRFLDPACGCGNFLVITYRELRELKTALLVELRAYRADEVTAELDVSTLPRLNVDQFYGIELEEFPARIAEVALWMTDHIANNRLSLAFGRAYARIPLRTAPHIHGGPTNGDALELNWTNVLPSEQCSYVLGNPPFSGFTLRDVERRAQLLLLERLGAAGRRLDLVSAWFLLAAQYIQSGRAKIGFVATNSITQGEQVPQLWPALFERYGLEIEFAHQTFEWGSDARGTAHVHVVVIGLAKRAAVKPKKQLFSYERVDGDASESLHEWISPYLFSADQLNNRHLVVEPRTRSLGGRPPIRKGVEPVDGGHYILSADELSEVEHREPMALKHIYPLIGGKEYINGQLRWIIVPQHYPPSEIRKLPLVSKRVQRVREYREHEDSGALARSLSPEPMRFHVFRQPKKAFLVIPEVSSIRREYVPIGWLEPPSLPSGKTRFIENATIGLFAILTSQMHMSWVRHIGGRVKSDYSYSGKIDYNAYPWPTLTDREHKALEELGGAVLAARAGYPDATLADLYDPNAMPTNLRKAHRALDVAVDRLYRSAPFGSDRERVEHLFGLYEGMVSGFLATPSKPKRGRRAAAV